MKIRIKDNSVRFRITLKELEVLLNEGRIEKQTVIPNGSGSSTVFQYAVVVDNNISETGVKAEDMRLAVHLSPQDFESLQDPDKEGVYVRREWEDANTGQTQRFMVFVEKDRPGSTCTKIEEWIYEEIPGQRPETRPIGGRA